MRRVVSSDGPRSGGREAKQEGEIDMRRLMWVSVLSVSVCLVNGVGLAQAQAIYPILNPAGLAPFTPDTGSSVTVTLSSLNWLPSPGATVTITVKSGGVPISPQPSISLICPDGTSTTPTNPTCAPVTLDRSNPITSGGSGTLTTSAYPGVCTNYTDPSPSVSLFAADFALNGNVLTSLDCGGMAVIRVTVSGANYTFIIPQDSDFDGIPDIWEAKFGPASGPGSLTRNADPDNDGLSNFDEYRGVLLTGSSGSLTHTRLHPLERDLFVALVNPGCGATDGLLDSIGTLTYIPVPTNARSLFENLNTLLPATATDPLGPRVHPVGYPTGTPVIHGAVNAEWRDDYTGCSFNSATGDLVFSGLSDLDRLVSRNAVYRVSESPNTTLTPSATFGTGITFTAGANVFNQTHVNATLASGSGGRATITVVTSPTRVTANITMNFASVSVISPGLWGVSAAGQKGLRCVESLDTSSTTVFASSGWATPDDTLSCTIFSKRIEFRMKNTDTTLGPLGLIPNGGTRRLRIQTTPDGGRSWTTVFTEGIDRAEAERQVIAEVMRFYTTMEYGHGGKLKPTLGTCGAHDCAGTGYIMDKDFVQVIDKSTSGFNTFRIPTISNSTLTGNFKLRTP